MHREPIRSRSYFGIKEEFIALALIAPLIFACMVTDPILVSVDNFNNGQPTVAMSYSGLENQTFDINISKYVARGNWSYDGVFPTFIIQMCPTSGSPSNLRLYFPEGNGSTLLHAGALGSCQNVSVDMSTLDDYFNTTSGTLLDMPYIVGLASGGGAISGANMMMLRNPKIYDVNEEVDYTLLWPYLESDAVRYTCFEGDSVRSVTTPAKYWNLTFALPAGLPPLPPMPIPLPISNNSVTATATIWDMPCPSYGVAGKYRADVSGVHIYLNNVLWPDFFNTTDDFNSSTFDTGIWDVRTVNASMPPINYSVLRLESPLVGTGVNAYYSTTVNPNSTQRFNITINISSMDINGQMGADAVGLIALFNGTSNPTTQATIVSNLTNMMIFNGSLAQVMCNPVTPGANTGLGSGHHAFTVSSEGNNISFFVDGVFLDNCSGANGIDQPVYYMFSPDALTDMWAGNMSVDSLNITFENWDGGSWVPYLQYYDNFTSLNSTAWTILNNTVATGSNYSIQSWMVNPSGFAYYVNNWTESKVDLHSYAADNGSGIVVYYDDPVAYADSSTTMFLINITTNVSEMEGDLAGVFLSRSKMSPDTTSNFFGQVGGAILYNSTHYQMFCDMSSSTVPNVTDAFTVNNESIVIFYDNSTITYIAGTSTLDNCSVPNSELYFGFTSDPLTDSLNGNSSIDEVQIAALNAHNVTDWRWYEPQSPVWSLIGSLFGGALNINLSSEVLIRDCIDSWNCPYQFNLQSDTAGTMDVSIVNITYESLIGYENEAPTVTLANTDVFSWMATNSTITDSEVRYQSAFFDSTVDNCDIIMSDLQCVDARDSTLHAVYRLAGFDNNSLGSLAIPAPSIQVAPVRCADIVNSEITGGIFLGGSMYNSEINGGGGLFMDFENALFEDYMLKRGTVTLNMTKYGANAPQWLSDMGLSNDSLDISAMLGLLGGASVPFGCYEDAAFGVEGFPEVVLGESSAPFACWMQLYDIHMIFNNMSITNSSIGGPMISLDNASFTIDNQSGPFNLKMRQEEAYLIFWNLNTSGGAISFDSREQYVEDDLLALNNTYYDWVNTTTVTIGFDNLHSFPGEIYYYPGFTNDHALVLQNGTPCNESNNCHNITWNAVQGLLLFNVTNFSTYVINRPPPPIPPSGGDEEFEVEINPDVVHEPTLFLTKRDSGRVLPFVTIRIFAPETRELVTILESEADGHAFFISAEPGQYYYRASKSGYRSDEGYFFVPDISLEPGPVEVLDDVPECHSDDECEIDEVCLGEECVALESDDCGYFENHAWISYECCDDSACGEGFVCVGNECVEVPDEETPVPPPYVHEPSDTPVVEVEGVEQPLPQCCLLGICGGIGALCWYWIVLIFMLLALALAAVTIYKKLEKPKKR